jgi:hypothetical protein
MCRCKMSRSPRRWARIRAAVSLGAVAGAGQDLAGAAEGGGGDDARGLSTRGIEDLLTELCEGEGEDQTLISRSAVRAACSTPSRTLP